VNLPPLEPLWSQTLLLLGLALLAFMVIGVAVYAFLQLRKQQVTAAQEEDLRQLVQRYEQLAEKTLDAQQRTATDVSELLSRTVSIEQILRTVD
jgi:uncharacterized protein HemX